MIIIITGESETNVVRDARARPQTKLSERGTRARPQTKLSELF